MKSLGFLLPQALLRTLAFHSTVIFCILIVLLVGGVFIWAAFFRKPSRGRRSRHHWKEAERAPDENSNGSAPVPTPRRRRKRRRPRQPLNPTLAETRGLPPVRDEESTPPPGY